MLTALLDAIKKIKDADVKRAALATFRMITKLQFEDVLTILLKQTETPLPREVQEVFMVLMDPIEGIMTASGALDADYASISLPDLLSNKQLAEKTLIHLLSVLNDTPLDTKTPTPVVMAGTCALSTIFTIGSGDALTYKVDDGKEKKDEVIESIYLNSVHEAAVQDSLQSLIRTHYAAVASTILMRCGTAYGVDEHISAKQAIRCLKTFFKVAQQETILATLDGKGDKEKMGENDDIGIMLTKEVENPWATLDSATYDDAITVITREICQHKPETMAEFLTFLSNFYSQQSYMGQRIVATTMLAEFVTHSSQAKAGKSLQSELIKFLLPRVADKVPKVRKQALRGLGNLVMVWNESISIQATAVISSLSGASEDTEAEVAAEAVNALTRIAKVVDIMTIGPMLVSICFRMRAAFDRKQIKVRKAAFQLFAELCRFGKPIEEDDGSINENFIDQVHFNVPIYLVHLNDEDTGVSECALKGLRKVLPLLHADLVELVNRSEVDEDNYDYFINDCTKLLALHFGDRLRGYLDACVGYFGSNWTKIRANAVYILGCLIRHSSESKLADARKKLNLHSLTAALVKMLEQDDEDVRNKTVKALSLLYDI